MSTSPSPLPSALMVPMAVEALVMNPFVRNWPDTNWRQFTPDWQGFARSGTPPFSNTGYSQLTAANDGVYLHWALPEAFRSASVPQTTQGTDDSIAFPLAPNRWIVVRLAPPANNSRAVAAWVIQSDYLVSNSSSATKGTSPFVQPFTSKPGKLVPATIGTNIPLATYIGDLTSEATSLFLTAAGPGDVSFAAYQPGVTDVFAFFDSSITATGTPAGAYDYVVMGWFSDPTADPLASATATNWASLLESLDWTVLAGATAPGQSAPSFAAATICHGSVLGVNWPGESTTTGPASSAPDPKSLTVVVGSTPLDALCTQIQSAGGAQGTLDEQHLQALMAGMLPSAATADGLVRVREATERARFGSTDGGVLWTVAPAPVTGMPTSSTVVSLPAALQTQLDALNAAQSTLNTLSRQLAAAQFALYCTWWKNNQTNFVDPYHPPEGLTKAEWTAVCTYLSGQLANTSGTQYATASALQTQVSTQAATVTTAQAALQTALGTTYVLKAVPQPRFYQPADPAVLVQGIAPGVKYGQNNSYTDGCLQCRFSAQLVGGIQYDTTLAITPAQLGSAFTPPANSALPANVGSLLNALCLETFFLNPANASLIAAQPGSGVEAAALETAMGTPTDQLGTAPAPIGLVATWQQPFTPLYLDWTVEFVPTPSSQMNGWTFDGRDYTFSGTVDATKNTSYNGRTLLTPHAAEVFQQRVEKYLSDAGSSADPILQQVLSLLSSGGAVDSLKMLAQSLSGLGDMQILLDPTPNLPPDSSVSAVVGHQYRTVPFTNYIANQDLRPPATMPFFPVRAGWFRFTQLDVLDCFGQCVNLLAGNANTSGIQGNPDYFNPITSPELAPDAGTTLSNVGQPGNWVRLTPRVVQTARLDLTLQPAVAGAAPGSNPVHGWLVPNHLDRSLAVYDADGILLGEVVSLLDLTTGAGTTAAWQPAPATTDAATPPAKTTDIADTLLQNAVTGLVTASADGAAFQDFLDVIDETQWKASPLGGRADANLSVLMGLPLAIVELQVQLSLEGAAAEDQSFTNTYNVSTGSAPNTANLLTQSFAVRLGDLQRGDDGVVGYFTNNGGTFNSTIAPATVDANAATSAYIAPIGAADNYLSVTVGASGAVTVPVLVDPRGAIHAISGIHPVATTRIPANFVTGPEATMALTFRSGPLLTEPDAIRMPRPSENKGAWSWLGYEAGTAGNGTYQVKPIIAANSTARLGSKPGVHEGWIQLSP